jgi:hypothetical protein
LPDLSLSYKPILLSDLSLYGPLTLSAGSFVVTVGRLSPSVKAAANILICLWSSIYKLRNNHTSALFE